MAVGDDALWQFPGVSCPEAGQLAGGHDPSPRESLLPFRLRLQLGQDFGADRPRVEGVEQVAHVGSDRDAGHEREHTGRLGQNVGNPDSPRSCRDSTARGSPVCGLLADAGASPRTTTTLRRSVTICAARPYER